MKNDQVISQEGDGLYRRGRCNGYICAFADMASAVVGDRLGKGGSQPTVRRQPLDLPVRVAVGAAMAVDVVPPCLASWLRSTASLLSLHVIHLVLKIIIT